MKSKLAKSLFFVFLLNSIALAGGIEGGGGGEPIAIEFAELAEKFALYSRKNLSIISQADVETIAETAKTLRQSLNSNRKSLIEVIETRPLDGHGTQKAAVFNRATKEVKIHRASWQNSDPKMRLMLVAMEMLGLVGVTDNRYNVAFASISSDWQMILSEDPSQLYKEVLLPEDSLLKTRSHIYVRGRIDEARPRLERCDTQFVKCETTAILKTESINGFTVFTVRPGFYRFQWKPFSIESSSGHSLSASIDASEVLDLKAGQQVVLQQQKVKLPTFNDSGRMWVRIAPALNRPEVYKKVLEALQDKVGLKQFRSDVFFEEISNRKPTQWENFRAFEYCRFLEQFGERRQQHKCGSVVRNLLGLPAHEMNALMALPTSATKLLLLDVEKSAAPEEVILPRQNGKFLQLVKSGFIPESVSVAGVATMRKAMQTSVYFGNVIELKNISTYSWLSPGSYAATFFNESGDETTVTFEITKTESEIRLPR